MLLFIPSAPFSKENNEALVQFKRKYDEKATNWVGFFLFSMRKVRMQNCCFSQFVCQNSCMSVIFSNFAVLILVMQ